MEEWKDIINYEGKYQVSNLGNVKNVKSGHILKGCNDVDGYLLVSLFDINYKKKTQKVHRLVGIAFIPNPDNLPVIDHINRDKKDNRIENLRWCSKSTNSRNRDFTISNTGIRHISYSPVNKRYYVSIHRVDNNIAKMFRTLDDAKKYLSEISSE
jgi:hypothetical protein